MSYEIRNSTHDENSARLFYAKQRKRKILEEKNQRIEREILVQKEMRNEIYNVKLAKNLDMKP